MVVWENKSPKKQQIWSMKARKGTSFEDARNLIAEKFGVDQADIGDLFLKVNGDVKELDQELFEAMKVDDRDIIQFWKKKIKTLQFNFDFAMEESEIEVMMNIKRRLRIKTSLSRGTRVPIPCNQDTE